MPDEIDTSNNFGVGVFGGTDLVMIALPVPKVLTRDDALRFAAWLVAVANGDRSRFDNILHAVLET